MAPTTKAKPKAAPAICKNADDDELSSQEGSLDIGACCRCHVSLDYSDRAAFFEADRHEDYPCKSTNGKVEDDAVDEKNEYSDQKDGEDDDESSYFFRRNDPYLPSATLYNPHNALVYCDTCNRLYHQQCHFVPLWILPRGSWQCLYCVSTTIAAAKKTKKTNKKTATSISAGATASKGKKATSTKRKAASRPKKPKHVSDQERLQEFFTQLEQAPPLLGDSVNATTALSTIDNTSSNKDLLFSSPPIAAATPYEHAWLIVAAPLIAAAWQRLLQKQLPSALQTCLANYRLACSSIDTWTSTAQNRKHINSGRSQELAQAVLKKAHVRYKIRSLLQSAEQYRLHSSNNSWHLLLEWCRQYRQEQQESAASAPGASNCIQTAAASQQQKLHADDFIERVIFPFGSEYLPAIIEPRTPEYQPAATANLIPAHVVIATTSKASSSPDQKTNKAKPAVADTTTPNSKMSANNDDMMSLDNLKCCICHDSTSTDENDLVLCDGHGCFRAYHMQCVKPAVDLHDNNDDGDDWFCPLCSGMAHLLHLVQSEYMGDDWEHRRFARQLDQYEHDVKKKKSLAAAAEQDDEDSLKSWEHVDQVFPTAVWEYETAQLLHAGKRTKDTDELLAEVLGQDAIPHSQGNSNADDEDDDNVEEDGHFDLGSFHEERRILKSQLKGNKSDNDSDSHSSQVSLVELSSVELEIDEYELAALSAAEDEDDDSDDDDNASSSDGKGESRRRRRSRRLRKRAITDEDGSQNNDPGKLDASNIVSGKRGRTPVDYIRLNEAIFGDLSDSEVAQLDDTDDFAVAAVSPTRRLSNDVSSDSDSDDEDGQDNGNEDGSASEDEGKETKAATAKSRSKVGDKKGAASKAAKSTPKTAKAIPAKAKAKGAPAKAKSATAPVTAKTEAKTSAKSPSSRAKATTESAANATTKGKAAPKNPPAKTNAKAAKAPAKAEAKTSANSPAKAKAATDSAAKATTKAKAAPKEAPTITDAKAAKTPANAKAEAKTSANSPAKAKAATDSAAKATTKAKAALKEAPAKTDAKAAKTPAKAKSEAKTSANSPAKPNVAPAKATTNSKASAPANARANAKASLAKISSPKESSAKAKVLSAKAPSKGKASQKLQQNGKIPSSTKQRATTAVTKNEEDMDQKQQSTATSRANKRRNEGSSDNGLPPPEPKRKRTRGATIAAKALNFVSSLIGSPDRK